MVAAIVTAHKPNSACPHSKQQAQVAAHTAQRHQHCPADVVHGRACALKPMSACEIAFTRLPTQNITPLMTTPAEPPARPIARPLGKPCRHALQTHQPQSSTKNQLSCIPLRQTSALPGNKHSKHPPSLTWPAARIHNLVAAVPTNPDIIPSL